MKFRTLRCALVWSAFFAIATSDFAAESTSPSSFRQVFPNKPNEVAFESTSAKFLRFQIYSSSGGDPAIDELLVFGIDDDKAENLARKDVKRVDASSCISGYQIHKIENFVDGRFGNDSAWVSGAAATRDAPQWLQIEWNAPVVFDRVVYSRDRMGRYLDRMPLEVEVVVSDDGENWRRVAFVRGVSHSVAMGGLTTVGSPLLNSAPVGKPIDWKTPLASSLDLASLTEYERRLREAYLAEENATLKTAGFANCEPWLLQRHYPEFVEPQRKPECILPAPILKGRTNSESALPRSVGLVCAFAPGSFDAGPLLRQTAGVAIDDDGVRIQIRGNRFLSEHLAMISTENLPTRGFLVARNEKVYWKQVDELDGRKPGDEIELDGQRDEESGGIDVVVPKDFLPEFETRGFYVALGIGGRWSAPGGRPIHFKPADFALSISDTADVDALFALQTTSVGNEEVALASSTLSFKLASGETVVKMAPGVYGEAGAEIVWECVDARSGVLYRVVGFDYDPCRRPLLLLKDMIARANSSSIENRDEKDFQKRVSTPGVINPRYVDAERILNGLSLPDAKLELTEFFEELENRAADLSDDERDAVRLWRAWQKLRDERKSSNSSPIYIAQERALYAQIRNLKRAIFLKNPDLKLATRLLANKRRPFWPSHNYSDLFDSTWNPGGAVVLIDVPYDNGRLAPEKATVRELVSAGDGVIRNPSQSFDATKIYYSHRASQNDYFRIYELDLATGKSRRVSPDGPFHDFWPTELPDGDLAFISTRCQKKFICWRPQAFVLYRMDKNGENLKPLSYANLSEFAPSVCDDGRIMWTRSEYVDKGADYGHTIWTLRPDGTTPELTFGNTINLPQGYANARRVPDSDDVLCAMISHFGDLNGPIALIDQSKGPHDPAAIRCITPEVPWPGFWARSETFREPYPISRDVYLVAYAALDRFGIYLLDRFGNRELLYIDDEIDTICPQPFGTRDIPPVLSGSFDPDLVKQKKGRFSIANVYRGLEGQVEPGAAKYLRICQEMPTPLKQLEDGTYQADHEPFMEYYASPVDILQGAYGWTSYVAKGVIGEVEIEEDGSVDFYAPAEKVLYFELLDENYNEIQRMRSVVQLQSGERRSCVGCHESRLSAPQGGLTVASSRKAQTIVPPPWGAGPFWYEKFVQPILDRRCVECHNSDSAALAPRILDLSGARDENKIPNSYRSLVQSGVVHYFDYTWGAGKTTKAAPYTFGVSKSSLFDILKHPPHEDVKLDLEEERAIKCWIDLNVPLWGDYTIRRERE